MSESRKNFPFDPKTGELPKVPTLEEMREPKCRFQFFECKTPHFYYGDQNSDEYCRKAYEECMGMNKEQSLWSRIWSSK